ncbi:class I tRNA ligase family protein, partial [Gemella sp. 19428wG2_WT2a]
ADIARLWVSSVDYLADVRISNEILKQTSDVYRKIRNTFRFLLGNVNDFNPATDSVSYDEMLEIDQYMHNRLNQFIGKTLSHYEAYDYLDIYQDIQNLINVDLSNFYLDYGKDILYIEKADSLKRRSMQTVLYETLVKLTKLLAPIIPHTADEIWGHIPHVEEESVHLTDMPEPHEIDTVLMEKWSQFMKLRDDVNRALEVARNEKVIGKSLEAHIT